MMWKIVKLTKKQRKFKKPILITGLPGVGNVAKLAVDFIVKELNAKPIYEFDSEAKPASVLINEQHLVELPHIYLYYAKVKGRDFFFLAGDFQPAEDILSYELSNKILNLFKELHGSLIVTLGAVGLPTIPKSPKTYCTSYSKKLVDDFSIGFKFEKKLSNVVGSIFGIAGLLVGLSEKKRIKAVTLITETYGHPLFLGVDSAKVLISFLDKKFGFGVKANKLVKKEVKVKQVKAQNTGRETQDLKKQVNYIG